MNATDPTSDARSHLDKPDHHSQSVKDLIRLAGQLGLEAVDVDELVYDTVHEESSRLVNSGACPELGFVDAFETLHDDADDCASQINNEGLEAQIRKLVGAHGHGGTEALLRSSAS
ncbi:hypothetical protein OG413_43625 [Streptomyces sp. NBC_01433]|uniref:hypothetical protein n=1 Tax=Streptomyces sp. NBC_01433 TaxID=2903864 RepID=UPI0022559743|nr:hypothetical protein [Streptomyces sp. NBC_01433]MCX4682075.1 hypothetical protein [Streptomyces sp. NBC_01433]